MRHGSALLGPISHGEGWGNVDVPCTCTHVRCYATDALLLHTCWMLRNWGWASCRRFLPNPIECAFFYGKMQNPFKSRPHFLQIFRQDNVCFAVTKITFFPEMEAPTSAVSGPAGCFCPIWLHVKWSMELNLPKL